MKIFTISILSILLAATILRAQSIAMPVGAALHGNSVQTTPDASSQIVYGADRVQLYPNPSTDVVHVTINLQQQEIVRLKLYNLLGQIVWSTELGKTQRVETTVPVEQLANGVYLLQVNAGNTIDERKVVVAK